MLVEKYITQTYGPHHVRVVRIMKAKGFLEEKDLTRFSLLP
jgi:transcription initiation factor IIE alpha subunit